MVYVPADFSDLEDDESDETAIGGGGLEDDDVSFNVDESDVAEDL